MRRKRLFLKISFVLLLLLAALHTSFIILGGPIMPTSADFLAMLKLMNSVQIDSGGGIMRTMQDFMDGFNIVVSIFLFCLPILSWTMLGELRDNSRALNKLTVVNLLAVGIFFLISLSLLFIGGTVLSGLVCLLLLVSLMVKNTSEIKNT